MKTLPSVAILILNWNGWPHLLECLESVLRLDYPNFDIIVCDNGSTDGSVERILDWAEGRLDVIPEAQDMACHVSPPLAKPLSVRVLDRTEAERDAGGTLAVTPTSLTLILNGANLGFAAGNNVGLRYAIARGYDFIWVLNPDTVVLPGALRPMVARMSGDATIGMCGSLICHYYAPEVIQEAGGGAYYPLLGVARPLAKERPVGQASDWRKIESRFGYVSAASCLVGSSFLREVGVMAEYLFLYMEEIDWAIRAAGRYRLALAPQSVVYHKKGRSTGSKNLGTRRTPSSSYFLWRARRRVTKRHHPISLPVLVSLGLLAAGAEYVCGRARSARAIVQGVLDREFD